jgi:hypothetical protein
MLHGDLNCLIQISRILILEFDPSPDVQLSDIFYIKYFGLNYQMT